MGCEYHQWCHDFFWNKQYQTECRDIKAMVHLGRPQTYQEFEYLMKLLNGVDIVNPVQKSFPKVCVVCGRKFNARKPDKEYCSVKCMRAQARQTPRTLVCEYCHKEFQVTDNKVRKYCSDLCMNREQRRRRHEKQKKNSAHEQRSAS